MVKRALGIATAVAASLVFAMLAGAQTPMPKTIRIVVPVEDTAEPQPPPSAKVTVSERAPTPA